MGGKSRQDGDAVSQEAAVELMRAADAVRRHFAAALAPNDITLQQYNVLRILFVAEATHATDEEAGVPTLTIAERMIEQTPGITRLLDRIERQGWIRRQRGESDRRQVWVRLTAAGRQMVLKLEETMRTADRSSVAGLSERQQKQLTNLSRKLFSSLAPDPGSST